jgi:hypothetical protein
MPDLPAAIAPGAGAGAVRIYDLVIQIRKNHTNAVARLRIVLINSLGLVISKIIAPETLGYVHLTYTEIILAVTALYGQLTDKRVDEIDFAMEPTLTVANFHAGTAGMTHAFFRSLNIGEAVPPIRQVRFLKKSCEKDPILAEKFGLYVHDFPTPLAQSFDAAVAFINIRLPRVVSTPSASSASSKDTEIAELKEQIAQLKKASSGGGGGKKKTTFCFVHGYGAHGGKDCDWMKDPSNGATPGQCAATKPGMVDGVMSGLKDRKPKA